MPTRWVSAYIAGLLLFAAPLAAQTTLPPITLGAGLRTSFVHTSPDGGDDTDAFVLDSARLYVNGPVTDKIKFMFNTEYDGASNKIGVLDAVARIEMSPKFNIWMGRFLPPSDRANLYGPVLLAPLGRLHRWPSERPPVRLPGPRQRRGVLGRLQQGEGLGRRVRRRVGNRQPRGHHSRPRPDRLLGQGDGLLPERHLLRREEPARHRRRDSGAGRQHRYDRRLPAGEEAPAAAASSRSKANTPTTTAGRLRRAYGSSEGAYVLGAFLFPETVGIGKFEVLGKYAKAASARAPRWPTTTRTPPNSTSTTSSRSSTPA